MCLFHRLALVAQRLLLCIELQEQIPLMPEVHDGGHVRRQRALHRLLQNVEHLGGCLDVSDATLSIASLITGLLKLDQMFFLLSLSLPG